jgi:hypothetical protein
MIRYMRLCEPQDAYIDPYMRLWEKDVEYRHANGQKEGF